MHPQINMQDIAKDIIQPVESFLNPSIMTPKKQKLEWRPQYQLIDFGVPTQVKSPAIKKKFKIVIQCKDKQLDKVFSKTIFFGQQNDYVFTGDKVNRLKKLMSLKHKNNPLHADYWRAHLCLSSLDFKLNCKKMLDYLIQKRFGDLPQQLKRNTL